MTMNKQKTKFIKRKYCQQNPKNWLLKLTDICRESDFKRRMHGGGNLSIGGKQEKDFWEVNIISKLATSGVNRACSEGCTGLCNHSIRFKPEEKVFTKSWCWVQWNGYHFRNILFYFLWYLHKKHIYGI